MARVYEVPYHPDGGVAWAVRISGRVIERFASRFEALRAAVNRASAEGGDTAIAVEGADGLWRPFGSDIKRPERVPTLPPRHLSIVQ
jgi:hypothetical protein